MSAFATRYQTVTVDGLEVFYREAGDPANPTVLLLHGFPSSSHMFRNLIASLSDSFHLVAPDHIGFGRSAAHSVDVAVDCNGRQLASKTISATTKDHLGLVTWAEQLAKGNGLRWAIEDCRHLSWRLERDLLAAGQSIVRVPPKLMAHVRDSARTYGKSDPIDALAVARAAQREPDLPLARLDGPDRDVRLLGDHRESLVAERTRTVNRLRWYLHELDPSWEPKARSLDRLAILDRVLVRLAALTGTVVRLARDLLERCRALTQQINELTQKSPRW